MAAHQIKINRACASLLANLLGAPGWYTDTAVAARACSILEMPELDQSPGDRKDGSDEMKAWAEEPVEFEISEKQRDAIKACIESHAKAGRFPLSKIAGRLLRTFGFEG